MRIKHRALTISHQALGIVSCSLMLGCSLMLVLASCATPYQSQSHSGGYTDRQIAPGVYRITFQGNRFTTSVRAKDFALRRAAELTLDAGVSYFLITGAAPSNAGYAEITIRLQSTPSSEAVNAFELLRRIDTAYGQRSLSSYLAR
jgi:hypothetical protein